MARLLYTALLAAGMLHARAQTAPAFYWPLNETSGTIAHAAAGGSDGTLQGNTEWLPTGGHHGGALRLNGNSARVDLGPCDVMQGTGATFSIACWFKPEIVSGTERTLMAKSNGSTSADYCWSLSLVNNTGARFRLRTAGTVHTVDVPPSSLFSGAWYHLAATYDGSMMRMYLNGSLVAFGNAAGNMDYHPEMPATLGNVITNTTPYFGQLDDVRIYGSALSDAEVIDLVIGDVSTGVDDHTLQVLSDGMLRLPSGGWTQLRVLDASGRCLTQRSLSAGTGSVPWADVPAGSYLVCLQARDRSLTRRVLVP